jgi:hypothetical protein
VQLQQRGQQEQTATQLQVGLVEEAAVQQLQPPLTAELEETVVHTAVAVAVGV